MNGINTTTTTISNSSSRRQQQHYNHNNSHYNSPSFSSSLLEEIYRSFDEDEGENHHQYHHHHHQHQHNNHQNNNDGYRKVKTMNKNLEREIENDRLRGVNRLVLEQWMDNDRINRRRNSMAAINSAAKFNSSSSTSSSDSSSGIGGFSSSDTESLYGSSKSKAVPTLKPIRTNLNQPEFHRKSYSDEIPAKKKGSKEGNLQKRALKLYGDLKKVKQPISPGGKLATFLNSLFNSNSSKKPKISSNSSSNVMKCSTSTPSTASSFSRSCLSKTPSSAGGRFERRSVRFCPVSTVIASTTTAAPEYHEDKRGDRWREKTTSTSSKNDEFNKVKISEKQRRVEEVAKELLKNYHQHGRKFQNDGSNDKTKNRLFDDEDEDEEEDDDDASCCSSDLFELENLLEVGSDHHRRYREELPVYETTHVHTNRAIANGLIL